MKTLRFRATVSAFGLVAAGLLVPGSAFAQQANQGASSGDEIVVTAQRREERLVDVPITVATLGEQALENANVQDLSDITRLTPGVRFDFASGFSQPTIRGVGTAVTTSGGGSNVGIYIDGFYSPNPLAADSNLTKVRSIQVLKGPQGTLFGRNTTGGAILIQTADPSTENATEYSLSYGRYNEVRAQAYGTFGISDRVAVDVEGMYTRGDGWQTNISNGEKVGNFENWTVRLGLKADLSDNVSLLLRYQHNQQSDPRPLLTASYRDATFGSGAPWFATPAQFTFDPDEVATGTTIADSEFLHVNSDALQGTIKADLGFADLTSYTQYRWEDVDSRIEIDYSGAPVFELGLPNVNRTFSQELLLNSKPGGPLQWTAGLFYFSNKDTYITTIPSNPPAADIRLGGSSTTTETYAAFLDMTYEVSPQLFVTAGARYSHDVVKDAYYNPQFSATKVPLASIKSDRVTPRFVVRYKPTDTSSIYASYTRGYKAAIIDAGGSCQNPPAFTCNNVQPETIDAFEVGYKYSGDRLTFELSGFYYDYKNLQVSVYLAGRANVLNAANSEIYGLDGQTTFKVSDNFRINAGAAWTHARYKQFNNAPVYVNCRDQPANSPISCLALAATGVSFPVVGQNLRNVTMQRTPEFTGNVGATYVAPMAGGELALTGNLFYSSSFFFGPSGIQFRQGGYEVVNLRAEWTDPSDTYSIAVYGDNVTNSRYLTQAQYSNFGIGANWSRPVTYGIQLKAKY